MYNALLPSIVDAWGVSKTVLAPLLMLNTGGAFVFGLLGGKVLKNVKAKTCMLIGSICCGLFLVGIGYIQSYVPFVLLGLLAGFSTGLSANGVRVSSGIMLLLSIFMFSPCVLRSVDSLNIVLSSGHHGAGSLFAASDSPSFSSIVSRTVISDDMSIA